MDRFRPNLVVHGAEPFEEDDWETIRIGILIHRLAMYRRQFLTHRPEFTGVAVILPMRSRV